MRSAQTRETTNSVTRTTAFVFTAAGLLLLFWATRLVALESFPPFVDEAFHLEFGRMVTRGSILDRAEEGRQFTIWWYVLFAAQTNDTFWVARAATLLADLPLPTGDVTEYMNSEGSGVGLAETAAVLTEMQAQRVIGILANCYSLRTITQGQLDVECPRLSPSGEDVDALNALMDESRAEGTFVVHEALPYAPQTIPGEQVATIAVRQPPLAIYYLAP